MVKVLVQLYPVIPATREEREQQRPMGRNRERYQTLLGGWHDIVRAADRLGVWGMATVEHHFHSEGYEVGPNPGVLDAYWAAITENVRVGQLGYVMSAQNPIRVAEETAILRPPLPRPDVRRVRPRLPVPVDEHPRPAPRRARDLVPLGLARGEDGPAHRRRAAEALRRRQDQP